MSNTLMQIKKSKVCIHKEILCPRKSENIPLTLEGNY
jgi:hypothetical protein